MTAEQYLRETLSAVAEHLRDGIRINYDPETGAQDYASAWDHEADSLVSRALHVLAAFPAVAQQSNAGTASTVNAEGTPASSEPDEQAPGSVSAHPETDGGAS